MIRTDDPTRRADLAAIHVGKKNLRLDENTYRALLRNLTGRESAAELKAPERKRVIEHMRSLGFKRKSPTAGDSAQARMVRGLWIELHKAGAVRDSSESALRHFCKRTAGVDSLRFATPVQLNKLIEALKEWTDRHARKVIRVDFQNGKRRPAGNVAQSGSAPEVATLNPEVAGSNPAVPPKNT